MGLVTPNMGIYIPAAGETNYDASFAAGMLNIDQHDHSGGPNKGVPIAASGLADGSVTYPKLNADVADTTTGIGTSISLPNQLQILGLLKNIYQIATTNGFLAKNGTAAVARTLTGTANEIDISNGDGTTGNPVFSLSSGFVDSDTFVPAVSSSGDPITDISYAQQAARWQTIGDWIMLDLEVEFSASTGTGNFIISNLPFATVTGPYWLSGYIASASLTPNQQTPAYQVNGSTVLIFIPGTGGEMAIPGGAYTFNMQMTGIYKWR